MSRYVVDASVVCKWFWVEPFSDRALTLLPGHELHAPELLAAEFVNVLRTRVKRGDLSREAADEAWFELGRSPVSFHSLVPLMADALHLSVDTAHPAYDCFYLALAIELGCQCVTADRRFYDVLTPAFPETMLWVEDVPA